MELDQYLGIFIDESKENLQKLNESLLKLENDVKDLEILNDIFRVAHTLKGMSRTMGYNNIADLTHHMENVLDPLRSGKIQATSRVIDILFKCLDSLEKLVNTVIDGCYNDKNDTVSDLINKLQELLNNPEAEVIEKVEVKEQVDVEFNEYEIAIIDNAKTTGMQSKEISITLTAECVLPGARAYMAVKIAEAYGELIKTHPIVEKLENGDFNKIFKLYIVSQAPNEEISKSFQELSEVESVALIDMEMDNFAKKRNIEEPAEPADEVKEASAPVAQQSAKVVSQTIRVSAERMDKLMNLVGELVISKTRISQLSQEQKLTELNTTIERMSNITGDIQEIVMKLRMVPIEQVFNRFPRLVRDISKALDKDINLIITGKDTEIDRVVIDEIGDPLVHLIRNSLDHGLETTSERISTGKSAKGTMELSAFNEGDNILIKVSDDGKGINPDVIKKIAINKELITKEAAQNMTDKDALELIFLPGFSTKEVASDLSGRGVGMDVVKSKVSQLGGSVGINSKIGEGTNILISLPSTMAIVQALLIRVGDETYATPLNYISEVIDVVPEQIKNIQNNEVIVLRGKTLPLIRLHKLLQVPNYVEDPSKPLTIVIVKSQGKYSGIIVSELIGQQEVVIKPINKKLCAENYISGATTLGNGQVALIINVNAFFSKA